MNSEQESNTISHQADQTFPPILYDENTLPQTLLNFSCALQALGILTGVIEAAHSTNNRCFSSLYVTSIKMFPFLL